MTIGDAITRLIENYNRLVKTDDIDQSVAVALFITMREAEKDVDFESM